MLVIGAGQAGLSTGLLAVAADIAVVPDRRRRPAAECKLVRPVGQPDAVHAPPVQRPPWAPLPEGQGPLPDQGGDAGLLADYARRFELPVLLNTRAEVVEPAEGGGFLARTDRGTISARHVVVATGPFSRPAVPAAAEGLDAEVRGSAFPRLVVLAVLLVVAVPGVVLLRRWRRAILRRRHLAGCERKATCPTTSRAPSSVPAKERGQTTEDGQRVHPHVRLNSGWPGTSIRAALPRRC